MEDCSKHFSLTLDIDMSKKTKICLHSMVGNEEKVILRMLESCYRYIDYYVIQCNGSDSTKDIINQFFKERNIPGFTYEIEWNFPGWNRDHALQECLKADHNCDWILRMDADEQLCVDEDFDWTILDQTQIQSWNITANSPGSFYYRTWFWNANLPWKFKHDKRHECIYLPEVGENFQRINLPKSFRHIITNDGDTWINPTKFLTDALELENQNISQNTLLSDPYHFFYVGKSYSDCYGSNVFPLGYPHQKEYARRCIFYFEQFIQYFYKGNSDEMFYYAQYLIGNAYKFCQEYENAISAYKKCDTFCSIRNEHLCGLVETYNILQDYETAYSICIRMMDKNRVNPFPNLAFLIHNECYYDTGTYVHNLFNSIKEKIENV
jgi:hypothetical protein